MTGATPGIQLEVKNTSAAPSTSALAVNSASGATTGVFTNTGGGPAGGFFVNAGVKPFTVNSSAKVGNLNADLLDGLDSAQLQRRVTGTCAAGTAVRVVNSNGSVACQAVGTGGGGWSLSGNAGTSPGANFLGTSDAHDLVVKTNGSEALRVTQSGDVGIGTTSPAAQLEADTDSSTGTGIVGKHASSDGEAAGVEGDTASTGANAVGVLGKVTATAAGLDSAAVRGINAGTEGNGIGVWGSHAGSGWGVYGYSPDGFGVHGESSTGWAGYFSGSVTATGNQDVGGNLNVGGTKNFRIDHPLDPANRYLVHASIESDEVLNIYSGNITTDDSGLTTVRLPEWFDRINIDYRYQLTVVDEQNWDARAGIYHEIADNQFTIRTDRPNVNVSWQVTARRNDPYLRAHPFQAEQAKTGLERGRYVTPQAYGRPASEGTDKLKPPPKPRP